MFPLNDAFEVHAGLFGDAAGGGVQRVDQGDEAAHFEVVECVIATAASVVRLRFLKVPLALANGLRGIGCPALAE